MYPKGYISGIKCCFDARGLQSTTLSDVAEMLKSARREARLSHDELAKRVGGRGRTIVARMDVLKYLPGSDAADFISLTMPVHDEPWLWPRDVHPFCRQNLLEG